MSDSAQMLLASTITGVVFVGSGVLMLWLARRSEQGRLPRNQVAGVRTSLTLSSEEAWYPAQRAAAPRTRIAGWGAVAGGLLGVLAALLNLLSEVALPVFIVIVFGSAAWLLGWTLAGASRAQRAARDAIGSARGERK